jgi:type I restriction enzyme S subunit
MNNTGDIPNGWQSIKLGKIIEVIRGISFPKNAKYSELKSGLIACLRTANIQKELDWEDLWYVDEKFISRDQQIIQKDDILISTANSLELLGKVAMVNSIPIKATLGTFIVNLRVPESANSKFYYFYFSSKAFLTDVRERASTTTNISNISTGSLKQIEVPLTSRGEQDFIVERLEELFSNLDKGIQHLKQVRYQARIYRKAILNGLASGLATTPIESVIETLDQGWSPRCLNEPSLNPNEWAVIKTTAVQSGSFKDAENKRLPETLVPRDKHELRKGDLLITRAGPRVRVGICCLVRRTRPRLLNCDKVYRIRINPRVAIPEYIELLLNSPRYATLIEQMKTGINDSGVNLTQKGFLTIKIPLPSLDQQAKLVLEAEKHLSVYEKIEEAIQKSLIQAEALRQSVLTKAFAGKLSKSTKLKSNLLTSGIAEPDKLNSTIESTTHVKNHVFPKVIKGITTTDLHAGILSMIVAAHEGQPEHYPKLSHVKAEKIAHLVESYIGIDLGRSPQKDAAGPDDYNHLKKVEHRAAMANWFGVKKLKIGHTYFSKPSIEKVIDKLKNAIPIDDVTKIENLIFTFLPFSLEHAEVIATLYAGWNNLLLDGIDPTDEQIVYEGRENWSKRKLRIERKAFFKALAWMKSHGFVPQGKGKKVT